MMNRLAAFCVSFCVVPIHVSEPKNEHKKIQTAGISARLYFTPCITEALTKY